MFLGYSRYSHECAVWDVEEKTIRMSRTQQTVTADRRFSVDALAGVNTRPKDLLHRSASRAHLGNENEPPGWATRDQKVKAL